MGSVSCLWWLWVELNYDKRRLSVIINILCCAYSVFVCMYVLFFCILWVETEPGKNIVELQSYETMDCCLVFSPTQVRFWPYATLEIKHRGYSSYRAQEHIYMILIAIVKLLISFKTFLCILTFLIVLYNMHICKIGCFGWVRKCNGFNYYLLLVRVVSSIKGILSAFVSKIPQCKIHLLVMVQRERHMPPITALEYLPLGIMSRKQIEKGIWVTKYDLETLVTDNQMVAESTKYT